MWNFLKGLLRSGVIPRKFFKTIWYLFLGITIIGILLSFKTVGVAFGFLFGPAFLERVYTYLQGKYLDIETVPYWGRRFGFKQTIKLLAEDKFHPYVFKNGKVCRKLKVSESGRWFSVAGRYYPVHLVKSFIRRDNDILMVDGTFLREQNWLGNWQVVEALQEMFADRGVYSEQIDETILSKQCKAAFKRVCGDDYKALGKADWDEVRYDLEKEIKNIHARRANTKTKDRHMREIIAPDRAKSSMYSRVLTDDEVRAIGAAIKVGIIQNIDGWFKTKLFGNDLCICNGVNILKNIGYPLNEAGEEFLFECITDIEKPYFEDAITALTQFPRERLIELIEKNVARAHAKQDVLFGAGLIYLAGKIDYEISLAKEKAGADQGQEVSFASGDTVVTSGGNAYAVQNEFEKNVLTDGKVF